MHRQKERQLLHLYGRKIYETWVLRTEFVRNFALSRSDSDASMEVLITSDMTHAWSKTWALGENYVQGDATWITSAGIKMAFSVW